MEIIIQHYDIKQTFTHGCTYLLNKTNKNCKNGRLPFKLDIEVPQNSFDRYNTSNKMVTKLWWIHFAELILLSVFVRAIGRRIFINFVNLATCQKKQYTVSQWGFCKTNSGITWKRVFGKSNLAGGVFSSIYISCGIFKQICARHS